MILEEELEGGKVVAEAIFFQSSGYLQSGFDQEYTDASYASVVSVRQRCNLPDENMTGKVANHGPKFESTEGEEDQPGED